jgi:hypothetical protein
MEKTRFLMIGGFLGAGKTTTISRLARHYTEKGLRVGLVTNDQAYGLVDTETLRAQGFHVGEVPGACFCCKFDNLVETAAALGADGQPDIILTEPVGSCTDLVATVLRPLKQLYGDRYELGPLAVLCKPEHGRKILGDDASGFSPQAAYIFLKQLEEAQVILLNKVDRLSPDEQQTLLDLLGRRFPDKTILSGSAATGDGFEGLIAALEHDTAPPDRPLEIDYDIYAEGEAALGWLNCEVHFTSAASWALDQLVQSLVLQMSQSLASSGMEPGHAKVLASSSASAADRVAPNPTTAVANLVASDAPVELSVASNATTIAANALINIRVHGDPDLLAKLVKASVASVARRMELDYEFGQFQHFRPARPEPTHRFAPAPG